MIGRRVRDGEPPVPDVLVVAPVRVHRESLVGALDSVPNVNVVGEARSLDEALPQLRARQLPAVALLDAPQLDHASPLATQPEAKLVAVGVSDGEAAAWIEAGASGVVPPESSLEELVTAVERVAQGELVAPPEVTGHLADRVRRLAAETPSAVSADLLTPRESEILDLIREGLSNKQIAQRLSIQLQTVKNHVHKILRKLGVQRRGEAAARRPK
jgi:two-component system, NarL family, nitrate/nitrite response regulator NarL